MGNIRQSIEGVPTLKKVRKGHPTSLHLKTRQDDDRDVTRTDPGETLVAQGFTYSN